MRSIYKTLAFITLFFISSFNLTAAENTEKLLSPGWSFKGFFGKFDRASVQRG